MGKKITDLMCGQNYYFEDYINRTNIKEVFSILNHMQSLPSFFALKNTHQLHK